MVLERISDHSHELAEAAGRFPFGDVPVALDILPESGREVVVVGDVTGARDFNHRQGDNDFGFEGTCGLVSCESVLRQFGIDVSEGDVVRHAVSEGLCSISDAPEHSGGTSMSGQARILTEGGVPANPVVGAGLDDLARWVGEGRGVIAEVNAGELWDDPRSYGSGQANHAISVTGAALDPARGELAGFYVNDSGRGFDGDSGRFVSVDQMRLAWSDAGGAAVVTEAMRAS